MSSRVKQSDIETLRTAGMSGDDITHSVRVAEKALEIAGRAEERFEEILRAYPRYGKNQVTLDRYLGYHREIQGLMQR